MPPPSPNIGKTDIGDVDDAAVPLAPTRLEFDDLLAGQHPGQQRSGFPIALGRHEKVDTFANDLISAVAIQLLGSEIPARDHAIRGFGQNRVRSRSHDLSEVLRVPFCPAAVRHINADSIGGFAVSGGAPGNQPITPVLAQGAVLEVAELDPKLGFGCRLSSSSLHVIGMDQIDNVPADHLIGKPAEQ